MTDGACRLCQKIAPLRNSHIIPEFFYEFLYDEIHRCIVLSNDPKKPNRLKQKGIREKLLCQTCETKLSRWEKYAKGVLFGGERITLSQFNDRIELSGISYSKFKLFQLSILWRAGVSKHELFSEVKLGKHEEILRKMILNDDPGPPYQYGCVLIIILHDKKPRLDMIDKAARVRSKGFTYYRFVFGGCMWVYSVSSHRVPAFIEKNLLDTAGTLPIHVTHSKSLKFLTDFAAELVGQGKL